MTEVKTVPGTTITFAEVIYGLKAGKKFNRAGWNGKGMHIQLHDYIQLPEAKLENGDNVYLNRFLVLVAKSGDANTWVPSISDLLAEDWIEVK